MRDSSDRKTSLKGQIVSAFSAVEYPGDHNLRNSSDGEEPYLLEEAFRGRRDWTALEAGFIDLAPDGFASALSFFSPAAFRFYLPAYLLADLEENLHHAGLVFHLTHDLTENSKDVLINPKRYEDTRWFEYVSERFAVFTQSEAQAIVSFLELKRGEVFTSHERRLIDEALANYWIKRGKGTPG